MLQAEQNAWLQEAEGEPLIQLQHPGGGRCSPHDPRLGHQTESAGSKPTARTLGTAQKECHGSKLLTAHG